MKKIILILSLSFFAHFTQATVIVVTCQNNPSHFLPVTINPVVGDTIRWTWVAGNHIVGPVSASDIPIGAAMWSAPIDASHLSFEYVVTVAGDYHYVCHPSTPHGEDAYMVAAAPSGIQENKSSDYFSFIFSNPVSEKLSIKFKSEIPFAEINVVNVLGEIVLKRNIYHANNAIFNVAEFTNGIYFIQVKTKDSFFTQKFIKE